MSEVVPLRSNRRETETAKERLARSKNHFYQFKLRKDIAVKIHQYAKNRTEELTEMWQYGEEKLHKVSQKIVEITSDCVDEILYSDASVCVLLNRYAEYKSDLERKIRAYTLLESVS